MMDNKSRMMGDCQVRFCERLKLKCFCLLDSPLGTRCCFNPTCTPINKGDQTERIINTW